MRPGMIKGGYMRKILCWGLLICLSSATIAYAENDPGKKLYRGAVNIVTAPVEIPKQARAYWIEGAQKTPHILVWIGSGAAWGIVQAFKRAGSGLWDVVSFPFEKPAEYQPLMKPAFVFDEWPRNPESGR